MDGITKERYGRGLAGDIASLIRRIRNGTYRPKPSRIVEIPKDGGGKRPLAIACFEDKLVQSAVSEILTRIYEPLFPPFLANIYLHEVIDAWFNDIRATHFKGMAEEVRYVDDMVFVFQDYNDARRFFDVLPKRLGKYGLEMHEDKSRLIRSGQNVARHEHRNGRRLPTYDFLGFTVYWAKARNGKWWRMKYKSRRDRFTGKLKGLKAFLKTQITAKDTVSVIERVAVAVKGWINYHTI